MRKAVFLDRDGVVNRERGDYTYTASDFEILPGVVDAVKLANSKNYLVIVVSNQGGVAKGIYSKNRVEDLHDDLVDVVSRQGGQIDEFYFRPHHASIGNCLCRKPLSLMLEKAIARYDIDATASFMIGDSQRDIDAATSAGVKGILVESNQNLLKTLKELI